MKVCFLLLTLIFERFCSVIASNCDDATDCSNCVGTFSSSDNCVWCTKQELCVKNRDKETFCADDNVEHSCPANYYTVVFVAVLCALLCLCCGSCFLRRCSSGWQGSPDFFRQIDPRIDREDIFRHSVRENGQPEWICRICGFDNHPRSNYCVLCGSGIVLTQKLMKPSFSNSMHASSNSGSKLTNPDAHKAALQAATSDLSIASSPIRQSGHKRTLDDGTHGGLSPDDRRESFHYRRLNQLSSRQKLARRRRIWVREFDDATGQLIWVRDPQKTKITTPVAATATAKTSSFDLFGLFRSKVGNESTINNDDDDDVESPPSVSATSTTAPIPKRIKDTMTESLLVRDSFGDAAMISDSPAFVTVLKSNQRGVEWEPFEGNRGALPSKDTREINPRPVSNDDDDRQVQGHLPTLTDIDLHAIAALPFREKHLWFVERIADLQIPWSDGHIRLDVSRETILADSMRQFNGMKPATLHQWMRVQFKGESGIDAGGLEREWFNQTSQAMVDPMSGLFECVSQGDDPCYTINPISGSLNPNHLSYFKFAGRLLGKALFEQQSLPIRLSLCLCKHLLSVPISFSDLELVDAELHKNLMWLRNNNQIELLGLDFTVALAGVDGNIEEIELKPNGANILVTDENKLEYLYLRLKHRMFDGIKFQLNEFLSGFYDVCPPDLISVFDYQELELLMCGIPQLDVGDWMKHCEYGGEYFRLGQRHDVIKWFWKAVESYSQEERAKLLQYCTGSARLPALGFKALQSNDGRYRQFNIQSVSKQDSVFPRAHTCFNKLDLPLYESYEEMEAYLSLVINMEVTGFTMD